MSDEVKPDGWALCDQFGNPMLTFPEDVHLFFGSKEVAERQLDALTAGQHPGYKIRPFVIRFTDEPQDDGWIKCSERLPEDGETVIARVFYYTDYPNFRDESDFISILCYEPSRGSCWRGDSNYNLQQVTHWRPLPAKPKGEANAN